jgi:nicotinamidase-related amidase
MPMPEMRDYTQPDFSAAALVIVDTQAGTLDGRPFEIPGTKAVLPVIGRLSAAFRKASRPIVHIVRIYQSDGWNVDLCRRAAVESGVELVIEDSPDCQIAPGLLPPGARPLDCALLLEGGIQEISAHEVVIYKPRWGAFYKTPLRSHLSSNAVSTLVFAGANFPNCPRASIFEASERDFRIAVARDALSGLYDRGIMELEKIGVRFLTAAEIIDKLK